MARKPSFIHRLVSAIWRTVVLLYSLVLLLVLIAVPAGLYLAFFHTPNVKVPNSGALVVAPVGNLVEQESGVGSLVGTVVSPEQQPSVVRHLIIALDRARSDDRIKSVFLKLDQLGGAAPGQLQDLVAAIDRFKKSGKPVIAWSSSYNQSQYELASHANTIYLDPMGYVFLPGYGAYHQYYKDALDKLGVTVNVFRVGKYKSYVEPYTRNSMSPAARSDNLKWLNSLWTTYRQTVTAKRKLGPDDINQYINGFAKTLVANKGDAATMAVQAGLVDKVATLGAVRNELRQRVGTDANNGSFRQINQADYLAATAPDQAAKKHIAVVTVEGDIVDGESVPGSAGGDTVARMIADARRQQSVAALILRVNSPGGSVTAAERIRRQIVATRQTGKPVVVSMAGLAASGGYWISMNANQIWAEPSTITGSIGIFGIVPTFAKPLNKLGIHTDGVGTTPLAGALRLDKPLSQPVKTMLQAGVNHGYRTFIGHVSKARGLSLGRVNQIAQGQVWSGAGAQRIGLVDRLGDFTQAEKAAARLAGLSTGQYQLQDMHPPSDWRGAIQKLLTSQITAALVPDWLSQAADPASALDFLRHGLNDPHALYARCFCQLGPAAQTLTGRPGGQFLDNDH